MTVFALEKLVYRVQGPDAESRFDLALRVPRRLIALLTLTDGPDDGHFVTLLPPPSFTAVMAPQLMLLVLDNTKLTVRKADKFFADFAAFADSYKCLPVPVTLNWDRRRHLFTHEWLAVEITRDDDPFPWNNLDSIFFIHTDDPADVDRIVNSIPGG